MHTRIEVDNVINFILQSMKLKFGEIQITAQGHGANNEKVDLESQISDFSTAFFLVH